MPNQKQERRFDRTASEGQANSTVSSDTRYFRERGEGSSQAGEAEGTTKTTRAAPRPYSKWGMGKTVYESDDTTCGHPVRPLVCPHRL